VRAKFSSTASAFGASPKRPLLTAAAAAGGAPDSGTPQAAAAPPLRSLDF